MELSDEAMVSMRERTERIAVLSAMRGMEYPGAMLEIPEKPVTGIIVI